MDAIRVAIADDHKIFRKGVILSLRPYTNIILAWTPSTDENFYKYCWDRTDNNACDSQNRHTLVNATSIALPSQQIRANEQICWLGRAYRGTDYTVANGPATWWCFATR